MGKPQQNSEAPVRLRLPTGKEVLGIVDRRVGGSRMIVKCEDGQTRTCRIPGGLRRSLWVREGDFVIVEPWKLGGDDKGDILYKYRSNQVKSLENKGYLEVFEQMEEF